MAHIEKRMWFEYEQPFLGEERCETRQERLRVSSRSLFKDPLFSLYGLSRLFIETKTAGDLLTASARKWGWETEEIDGLWTSLRATANYFYQKKQQATATSTQIPKMNVKNNCKLDRY